MKTIKPEQILEVIDSIGDNSEYVYFEDGFWVVTSEWLVGTFAGRAFVHKNKESALQLLIDYLHDHVFHDSMVGYAVDMSGFPDIPKMRQYITSFEE